MNLPVFANLVVFALTMAFLVRRRQTGGSVSSNVLLAVVLGVALGALAQAVYGLGSPAITGTLPWVGIVGTGYVRLLQMVIAPLVLVSILAAVTKLSNARSLGAISGSVLGLLMVTTAISALIGIGMTQLFGLRADSLVQGARELEKGSAMQAQVAEAAKLTIPALLQSFVPSNIFADLAGTRSTSVIGVVIFAALLGLAALSLRKENPEVGERVHEGHRHLPAPDHAPGPHRHPTDAVRRAGVDGEGRRHLQRRRRHQSRQLRDCLLCRHDDHHLHARDDHHAGRAEPGALLPEDLAGADFCLHLAVERGDDSAQRGDAGGSARRVAGDRELRGQLRRHDRPERLRRPLPGDARGDDRAERGRRSRRRCHSSARS